MFEREDASVNLIKGVILRLWFLTTLCTIPGPIREWRFALLVILNEGVCECGWSKHLLKVKVKFLENCRTASRLWISYSVLKGK